MKDVARRLARLEPAVLMLGAPLLLFPTLRPTWTVAALAALLLVWLLGWIGTGRPGTSTPLDVSLLVLALTVLVAVWASALPELTLPKLTGIILGLAAFRATTNAVRTAQGLAGALAIFLLLGLGLSAFGLVATAWLNKLPMLGALTARIPQLVQSLPGAEAGIHPNELGGCMTLVLPVSLVAWRVWRPARRWAVWVARVASLLLALFFVAVLVLTQSRSAWIGASVGLATMVWLCWHRARWLMVVLLLALGVTLLYLGPQVALDTVFRSAGPADPGTMLNTVTLQGRIELWNRALYAIQDFPFTGCGLGAFRRVVHVLYPLFLISPDLDIGHAHNVFLQIALDVGLPGLIAYLALVGAALWIGLGCGPRCAAQSRPRDGQDWWLGLGIVGSLVAFHVYGLTDAIALGAKPGVALWMLLALAAALWRVRSVAGPEPPEAAKP